MPSVEVATLAWSFCLWTVFWSGVFLFFCLGLRTRQPRYALHANVSLHDTLHIFSFYVSPAEPLRFKILPHSQFLYPCRTVSSFASEVQFNSTNLFLRAAQLTFSVKFSSLLQMSPSVLPNINWRDFFFFLVKLSSISTNLPLYAALLTWFVFFR
jgi:hypothetical protein